MCAACRTGLERCAACAVFLLSGAAVLLAVAGLLFFFVLANAAHGAARLLSWASSEDRISTLFFRRRLKLGLLRKGARVSTPERGRQAP